MPSAKYKSKLLSCLEVRKRGEKVPFIPQQVAVSIKIFSPAKTVADFFKFRNKFGIDIAIEALREGWQKHLFTSDELYMAAKECRVSRVIEPYIESIIL